MPPPVNIIFDTDMSIDVDDVGALCVAHALADRGEVNILAALHNSASPLGVGAISVINSWYGRSDIPVGAYAGRIGDPQGTSILSPWGFTRDPNGNPPESPWQIGPYVPDLVRNYPSRVRSATDADGDAVTVLRRTLAAAEDHSVTIVSVGYATNLHDLLLSTADTTSALSGRTLVQAKVQVRSMLPNVTSHLSHIITSRLTSQQLVLMGGREGHIEWNFAGSEESGVSICGGAAISAERGCGPNNNLGLITNQTIQMWPRTTPLTFLDYDAGASVLTGGILARAPGDSPCKRAYEVFCKVNNGWCSGGLEPSRSSWDIQALVYAVRGSEGIYEREQGSNFVDPLTGINEWTPLRASVSTAPVARTPPALQYLLHLPAERRPTIQAEIEALLAHLPLRPPQPPRPPPAPQTPQRPPPTPAPFAPCWMNFGSPGCSSLSSSSAHRTSELRVGPPPTPEPPAAVEPPATVVSSHLYSMLSGGATGSKYSPPSSSRPGFGSATHVPTPPAPPLGAWSPRALIPYLLVLLVVLVVLLLCTMRRQLMKAGNQSRRAVRTVTTRAAMIKDAARRAQRRAGAADDGLSLAKNEEVRSWVDEAGDLSVPDRPTL